MKHRTQVLFEPSQYAFLKALSRQERRGLGEILRDFVEEKRKAILSGRRGDPLKKIIGSIRDKECTSENFEDYLYGRKG